MKQLSPSDQTRLFRNLLTRVGYGNPHAPVWFIGIEDGGEGWTATEENRRVLEAWGPATQLESYPAPAWRICQKSIGYDRRTRKCDGRKGTKIYRYMDYVVSGGRNTSWNPCGMSLVDASGRNTYFQMNLYPLARPNTRTWPRDNEVLFGFAPSREDRQRYADVVRLERFKILRDYWQDKEHHPVLTVCFGKTFWPDYRHLFGLREQDQQKVPGTDGRIVYYPEQRIARTPFFNPCQLGAPRNLKPLLKYLTNFGVSVAPNAYLQL